MNIQLRDYQKAASDKAVAFFNNSEAKKYQRILLKPFMDINGSMQNRNINRFGKVEDLKLIDTNGKGKWAVFSNGKQLTNVLFQ